MTETELIYKIRRNYLTMLGIYTRKEGRHRLTNFISNYKTSMIKFTKMITF